MLQEDIERFIRVSPPNIRDSLREFRRLILEEVEGVEEAYKWKCPFYSYKGILCYLFGSEERAGIGFCRGNCIKENKGLLVKSESKMMRHYVATQPSEIDEKSVRLLLREAIKINETQAWNKKAS